MFVSPSRRARAAAIASTFAVLIGLAGCSAPSQAPAPSAPGATSSDGAGDLSGTLTIYAAASLTSAFDALAAAFTTANPGVEVDPIVYDGSSTLATQINEGADVDVFASADEKNMAAVAEQTSGPGQIFARNTLRIATPPDNPGKIATLADLAGPGLAVVLCAPEVPCGAASAKLLDAAGVSVTPASEEQNVKAVLTKVTAGEADAGLVYATDVAAAGDAVHAITPEGADQVVNSYPVAALTGAENKAAADAFVAYVLSAPGQEILAGFGFEGP